MAEAVAVVAERAVVVVVVVKDGHGHSREDGGSYGRAALEDVKPAKKGFGRLGRGEERLVAFCVVGLVCAGWLRCGWMERRRSG